MRITDVDATVHEIQVTVPILSEPVTWSIVFVTVRTADGPTGYGLTAMPQVHGIERFTNREVAPLLVDRDPRATQRLWDCLEAELNPRSQTGVWSSAVSAVDIALWDLVGKHLGEPVWRLLGGARRTVPTYRTFGLLRYDVDQLVEVAERVVADGARRVKMKVGIDDGTNPREDAERVRAVRDALGSEPALMIDGNYTFSPETALELCNRLDATDITWFEEPVAGNDVDLLADLRERTAVPIAAGQNEGSRVRHRHLIANGAVDVSQPNVCHVGGFSEATKVAALADSFNRRIANGGTWPHHNMHLHAGVSNGWLVEFHHVSWEIGETIFQDPPSPTDGTVTLPEEPGLGLTPDESALEEHRLD